MKIIIVDREANKIECTPETVAEELIRLGINPYVYYIDEKTGMLVVGMRKEEYENNRDRSV